jgi:hypothetical protein
VSDRTKEILSIFAAFIAGFGPAYYVTPDPSNGKWIGWIVAGLMSLGTYIGGYSQTNPRLQPRTPEALLDAVKKTDLPPAAKETAAEVLGSVVTTAAAAPAVNQR